MHSSVPGGVWSAAPTPFTETMAVDGEAIKRMVEHHWRLGVVGLFLAGTNGEGPWLTRGQRQELVEHVVRENKGRMTVAVQVTENSSAQILENVDAVKKSGADIAVLAPPYYLVNATAERILELYLEVIRNSSLPIGIYDRGLAGPTLVPDEILAEIYDEANVILVKDSSGKPSRRDIALAAKKKRPGLVLLNGDEFHCVGYLTSGYDGLLLGGGVFNGYLARRIVEAVQSGDLEEAESFQQHMNRIMWDVYGGKEVACWLSGEKKLLVELGVFRTWKNYPRYPLTDECAASIARLVKTDRDVLLPQEAR